MPPTRIPSTSYNTAGVTVLLLVNPFRIRMEGSLKRPSTTTVGVTGQKIRVYCRSGGWVRVHDLSDDTPSAAALLLNVQHRKPPYGVRDPVPLSPTRNEGDVRCQYRPTYRVLGPDSEPKLR